MEYMNRRHRLCITSTITESHPKALVVFRGLEESLKAASEIGYDGIELALYHKDNVDAKALRGLAGRYKMAIPVISTGQMYTMGNVSFTHPDREIRRRAVEDFEGIIEVAAELGADVNVSRVRGSLDQADSYDEGLEKLSQCLVRVCAKARSYGLAILLEQMNRYETNYLFSCAEIGDYIRRLGIPNLKIHADLFHMNIEDVDLPKTLKEYADILGYIHFADSNRLAPGKGNIDFASILESLDEIKYPGWIGVEILPKPSPLCAARESLEYLRALEWGLSSGQSRDSRASASGDNSAWSP